MVVVEVVGLDEVLLLAVTGEPEVLLTPLLSDTGVVEW